MGFEDRQDEEEDEAVNFVLGRRRVLRVNGDGPAQNVPAGAGVRQGLLGTADVVVGGAAKGVEDRVRVQVLAVAGASFVVQLRRQGHVAGHEGLAAEIDQRPAPGRGPGRRLVGADAVIDPVQRNLAGPRHGHVGACEPQDGGHG
ncbi:hypothetical protein D3C80_1640920 [compost metagenome]